MDQQNNTKPSRAAGKKRSSNLFGAILILCLVGVVAFVFLQYQKKSLQQTDLPLQDSAKQQQETVVIPAPVPEESSTTTQPKAIAEIQVEKTTPYLPSQPQESEKTSELPIEVTPYTNTDKRDCSQLLDRINTFYAHLDNQQYIESFNLSQPSQEYINSLIQKLLDTPPIVSGETDDLYNILKNTAHFFRIVGKDNIALFKTILANERDTFESFLRDYYLLLNSSECIGELSSLTIHEDSLYDYAGFFLNTMGGSLYLFRRDSVSRLVVSYYSILLIDRANRDQKNRHGIDLRPALETLIDEFENSGIKTKYRDEYLNTLYQIQDRYM